jgi:energy-coupling factor transporter ATP-binding protein EcfA2
VSSFRRFVCWEVPPIESVLNPDALQTSDPVFLATHHPMRMWRDSNVSYDEQSFLREFLKPRDYALVPILGHAGMGKSHLVRWLAMHIPETRTRKVLLVRKAATNLRQIIRLIIRDAKGKVFDDYRKQLDAASSDLASPEYAREKFLDNLALETSRNCARGVPRQISEQLSYVIDKMPAMLRDSVFRHILLERGNVVERLTSHIIGKKNEIARLDERRQFSEDVIPAKITDIPQFKRAGADARELFEAFISYPELRKVAIGWLNASLNDALAALLSLRNNRLFDLMLELRRQLARDKIELVLLIEDFALLQGVDQQLLEALLVRPEQGEHGRMCAMRAALACTTGYYDSLPETVRQRVDFTVTLDTPGFQLPAAELSAFAARYLNALRLPGEAMETWFGKVSAHGDSELPVPSACKECTQQEKCWDAFGTGGSAAPFGLYPFTETALLRMQDRVTPESFNPRLIIKHVLKAVLDHHTEDLRKGRFPAPEMRQSFTQNDKSRLPGLNAGVALEIQRRDKVNANRREVLLDLWSNGDALVNLAPGLHEAFDLPELTGVVSEEQPSEPVEPTQETEPKVISKPDPLVKQVDEINRWVKGDAKLTFNLADRLRQIIFGCLDQYFPWDTEFLIPVHYKEFRNTSIDFPNQQSLAAPSKIRIAVPRNSRDRESMAEVGVLLQGLLRFDAQRGWEFPGGESIQRLLARYLEDWSVQLGEQIRAMGNGGRDPVPAGIEVLVTGIKLVGGVRSDATDEDLIAAALGPPPAAEFGDRASAWRQLAQDFLARRKDVLEIVVRHAACSKGGDKRVKILDAAQFLVPLRALRKNDWLPSCPAPDLPGTADLQRLHQSFRTSLSKAVAEEAVRVSAWQKEAQSALGDKPNLSGVIQAVTDALKACSDAGMGGAMMPQVTSAADQVRDADVGPLLKKVADLNQAGDLLTGLALLDQAQMANLSAFIAVADKALAASTQRLEDWLRNSLKGAGKQVLQVREKMEQDLTETAADLQCLSGEPSNASRRS